MLVRPRILGSKSSELLETKEPRRYSVEFDGPWRDTDTFEITLPPGFEVDDLPPAANADYPFASYHSKTEVTGNVLRYTRSFEVKQLTCLWTRWKTSSAYTESSLATNAILLF